MMNKCTGFCVGICFYLSWVDLELPGHIETLFSTFGRTVRLFPSIGVSFYIPTNSVGGFLFLHVLAKTFNNLSLWLHPSCGCEVVSYCGFDLHFSNDK